MAIFPLDGPVGPLTGLVSAGDAGAGVPLVLVHGIQGTASSWSGVMEQLPDGVAAFAPNLRGRGGSAVPREVEAYSLEGFAADLATVVEAAGVPVLLAGWSMGVPVALEYLRRTGHGRVLGLALISGTPCPGVDGAVWFRGAGADDIAAEARDRARRLGLREWADPIAVAGAWLACRRTDLRTMLPEICCPTLVLHGTEDDQCPYSHGELLARKIPGARLVTLPEQGHNVLAGVPGIVARELIAFRSNPSSTGECNA